MMLTTMTSNSLVSLSSVVMMLFLHCTCRHTHAFLAPKSKCKSAMNINGMSLSPSSGTTRHISNNSPCILQSHHNEHESSIPPDNTMNTNPHYHTNDTPITGTSSRINRRGALRTAGLILAGTTTAQTATYCTMTNPPNNHNSQLLAKAADDIPNITTSTGTTTIPQVQLGNSSLSVSRTIQGYWQLAGGHGKYVQSDAIQNMIQHYNAGMNTLDTADIYGPSESIIGQFVQQQQQVRAESNKQEEQLKPIVCTKFCCFRFLEDIDKEEVRRRILKSRERLQVDKIPLVQFFWSNYDIKRYVDVALMLTELKEEGLIQEIGATNFDLKRLIELKEAGVPIVSHQVQLSCIDQRPIQSGMSDYCADNNISLIAYGSIGSGILSDKYLNRGPLTQEELNTASMRLYKKTADRFGDWKLIQELLSTLHAIAMDVRSSGRCANANISNVAQRYVLDTKAVASVLIGVRNSNHIEENVRTHSFQLTNAERDAIDDVIKKRSGPKGDVWDLERESIATEKKNP